MNKQKLIILLSFLASLVLPFLVGLVIVYGLAPEKSFKQSLELIRGASLVSPIISVSVLVNLALFFIFIRLDKYIAARAVIFGTLIYGIAILILKLS